MVPGCRDGTVSVALGRPSLDEDGTVHWVPGAATDLPGVCAGEMAPGKPVSHPVVLHVEAVPGSGAEGWLRRAVPSDCTCGASCRGIQELSALQLSPSMSCLQALGAFQPVTGLSTGGTGSQPEHSGSLCWAVGAQSLNSPRRRREAALLSRPCRSKVHFITRGANGSIDALNVAQREGSAFGSRHQPGTPREGGCPSSMKH